MGKMRDKYQILKAKQKKKMENMGEVGEYEKMLLKWI
jgi:hypothetical protein